MSIPDAAPALHALLLRQLRRERLAPGGPASAEQLAGVLACVSRSYAEADQERYLMERSQALSSAEMGELHAELKASQSRLASLLSLSSDWVWEQDVDGRFTWVSPHAGATGTDLAARLPGLRPAHELAPAEAGDGAGHLARMAARQPFRNFTCGLQTAEGQPFFIRLSGEPWYEGAHFRGWRGVGSDVTLDTLAQQRVRDLASYDCLTGLANRRMFSDALEAALLRAAAAGQGLALFFIDLDHFKQINDTHGHEAGDELLRAVSRRLSGLVRDTDLVARLGGDEFVVLVEGLVDPATLSKVASRMLGLLCEPLRLREQAVQVSASVGISLFPADGQDAAAMLKNADAAMYLAKTRGKNNFQFFTPELGLRATRHFAFEAELRLALAQDELRLHYQPRYRLADQALIGLEALLRWQHPQRGLLGTEDFLALAEESGLIVPIGRWVMEETCRQLRAWRDAGLQPPRCAVNLSARQLASPTLVDDLALALAAAGLEASALELGVTEAGLTADPQRSGRSLRTLQAMGLRITIDHFGTGALSLPSLRQSPARAVKIDRSFIDGLPGAPDDLAITQAMIAMARALKLGVAAEGVATREQLALLRDLGCEEAQGPLLCPPLPPATLQALLLQAGARQGAESDAVLR